MTASMVDQRLSYSLTVHASARASFGIGCATVRRSSLSRDCDKSHLILTNAERQGGLHSAREPIPSDPLIWILQDKCFQSFSVCRSNAFDIRPMIGWVEGLFNCYFKFAIAFCNGKHWQ
jgi:hypothetical protein